LTTRKQFSAVAGVSLLVVLLTGCATPGPMHVYSLRKAGERNVIDTGIGRSAEVPSFLEEDDVVSGFAYDPFTDHFFLRLQPGNKIRVVDRPARAIKREFEIDGVPADAGGDLAARPKDGHLFLLQPGKTTVLETSRFGKLLRTITLSGIQGAPTGIAVDMVRDRLLVLGADGRRVTVHDLQGARAAEVTLDRAVCPSLAFDAERREYFAPLRAREGEIGVFDENGRFLRTNTGRGTFVDVGVRSAIRVF
jgi:hypothetical protein